MLKQRHKLNFRELVLRCFESSDAEQRRIFHRMLHATTRNKQKTRNRRNKHCFGTSKTGAPRAAHKQHPHLLPNTLSSKGANEDVLLRYTRHFDRLALRPIEAGAPQNWGSLSTTSRMKDPQSWGESVSISKSYDRNKTEKNMICPT